MSIIEILLQGNQDYARSFSDRGLPAPPSLGVAIVACMDARLDISRALGLEAGQAHVIRNAGGVVTDDVIRSLIISQRQLGTREIVLVHHTQCGMATFEDAELREEITAETGDHPRFPFGAFTDVEASVRDSIAKLVANPFLPYRDRIRGFVFDVATGQLEEVSP